jgi:hypothetical protein
MPSLHHFVHLVRFCTILLTCTFSYNTQKSASLQIATASVGVTQPHASPVYICSFNRSSPRQSRTPSCYGSSRASAIRSFTAFSALRRRRHGRRLPRTADSSYSVHHSMPASPNAKIGTWPTTAASTAEFPIPHPPPEPSRLTASSDNLLIINGLRESHLSTKTPSHPKYY